ncbi:lipopolysaccharide heptosyltransferase I [Pseudomonas sp. F1_0610]|uniref:lipopolysaccharide heptosyltransferase I n=1 Tax=Pseudomonas sp. F1_0610 TaxID=3114284 RepID=UPI0039C3DEF0
MRVLLIKTSSLGDVVHTLPALTDAMRAIDGIAFDWIVEEGFAEIPALHPAVDQVIPVAIRRWRKNLLKTWFSGEWKAFKKRVKTADYDLVIDAQGLLKSAWLTRYNSAPIAGFDDKCAREPLASSFYDRKYFVDKNQHAVERVRQLFAQALGYPLAQTLGDYALSRDSFIEKEAEPYLVFLHGTTWKSKHWPEAFWRELAEKVHAQGYAIHLPWGNEVERTRAERIAKDLPKAHVLPRLSLSGMAAQIASATACVAVDTGLGHLAAALDVPCISLYGPTLPGKVGAYGKGQVHLCATGDYAGKGNRQIPCFDSLTPAVVLPVLDQILTSKES